MSDFRTTFQHEWTRNGGLVPKNVAAKIAGMSAQTISDKIRNGELETVELPNVKTTFIPLPAAMSLSRQRAAVKPSKAVKASRAQKPA